MDFLTYLSQDVQEIIQYVRKAKYRVSEDTGLCSNTKYFGFTSSSIKSFVICTSNIKRSGLDYVYYINETVLHEAVHVAQHCRGGPFWISQSTMKLTPGKDQDVANSAKTYSGPARKQIEHEAYWMEDKPNEVKYVLKRYCL